MQERAGGEGRGREGKLTCTDLETVRLASCLSKRMTGTWTDSVGSGGVRLAIPLQLHIRAVQHLRRSGRAVLAGHGPIDQSGCTCCNRSNRSPHAAIGPIGHPCHKRSMNRSPHAAIGPIGLTSVQSPNRCNRSNRSTWSNRSMKTRQNWRNSALDDPTAGGNSL